MEQSSRRDSKVSGEELGEKVALKHSWGPEFLSVIDDLMRWFQQAICMKTSGKEHALKTCRLTILTKASKNASVLTCIPVMPG